MRTINNVHDELDRLITEICDVSNQIDPWGEDRELSRALDRYHSALLNLKEKAEDIPKTLNWSQR